MRSKLAWKKSQIAHPECDTLCFWMGCHGRLSSGVFDGGRQLSPETDDEMLSDRDSFAFESV